MTTTAERPTGEARKYMGGGLKRKGDPRLITGQGRFTDDINLQGMLHLGIVRSPVAHARVSGVETKRAADMPGVVAVYTGAEIQAMLQMPLPMAWPISDDLKMPPHWPVTSDKARHVGDAVAVVVATSRAAAVDGAEAVEVSYDPLPAVIDPAQAMSGDAAVIHDEAPDNVAYRYPFGDADATARAFASAAITVKQRLVNQRLAPIAIEPRAVVAQPTASTGELTIWSSTQIPHLLKIQLGLILGVSEPKIRVIAPDVGGGFGSKLNVYADEVIAA